MRLGDQDIDYQAKPIPPDRRGGYRDYWLASDLLGSALAGQDSHPLDD